MLTHADILDEFASPGSWADRLDRSGTGDASTSWYVFPWH